MLLRNLFIGYLALHSLLVKAEDLEKLKQIATSSLESNIKHLESGYYLSAGKKQFGSLWTRDFAHAASGLLSINHPEVVRDHLNLIFRTVRADGLVPRGHDSFSSSIRVAAYSILRNPGKIINLDLRDPLKTEYVGEHKTVAMDSNALTLITAYEYYQYTKDEAWLNFQLSKLQKIFHYYDSKMNDGLLSQQDYGDWQDSVKRKGKTFYNNILYWKVLNLYKNIPQFNITQDDADNFKQKLIETFLDQSSGLFVTHESFRGISLDGNLMALDFDDFFKSIDEKNEFYTRLKNHTIWGQYEFPGQATTPNYPKSWASFNVKIAGIKHYHDSIVWSWLMGYAAKVATKMNDQEEALRIFSKLEDMAVRDGAIGEIYNPRFELVRTKLYRSEIPFSWGSGKVLEAISEYEKSVKLSKP